MGNIINHYMTNNIKRTDVPVQGVTDVNDWMKIQSHLDLKAKSITDLSEKDLVLLLADLKVSLKTIAKAQREIGGLKRVAGQAVKAARKARVKSQPLSRKVVLTVEEYEHLKSSGTNSDVPGAQ